MIPLSMRSNAQASGRIASFPLGLQATSWAAISHTRLSPGPVWAGRNRGPIGLREKRVLKPLYGPHRTPPMGLYGPSLPGTFRDRPYLPVRRAAMLVCGLSRKLTGAKDRQTGGENAAPPCRRAQYYQAGRSPFCLPFLENHLSIDLQGIGKSPVIPGADLSMN